MTYSSIRGVTLASLLILLVALLPATVLGQSARTEKLSGTVLYVHGNHVGVRLDSGETKDYQVPDDATATVDGRLVSFRDLKPGTHLTRTIKTVSKPKIVETTEVKRGVVWHVSGTNLIVTHDDGVNRQYKVPGWFKFDVDGQEKTVFDLRKGMYPDRNHRQ